MGLRDFFMKKRPKAATSAAPSLALPADNPGVTKIEREHFLLHAPFQWVAIPGDNPLEFEFRNQTLHEQLIVTVLLARKPLNQDQLQQFAKELGEKRLNAISTVSHGRSVHAPLQVKAESGDAEVRCFGHDEPQRVRFAFVVRATPAKVITASLTRYFLEEVGSPFETYCGIIFDFLQVKDASDPAGT